MFDKTRILNDLKKYKNFNKDVDFAKYLGISTQNLSVWYKRGTFDENKLLIKFPEVNRIWLLTGDGEMLKSGVRKNDEECGSSAPANVPEKISQTDKFLDLLKTSQEQLSESQAMVTKLMDLLSKKI